MKNIIYILIILNSFSCASRKEVSVIDTKKVKITNENSKTDSISKIDFRNYTSTITPEIIEKNTTPIAKDNRGNLKDIDYYKKIGDSEFWYGLKSGNIYFNYKVPEKTEKNTIIKSNENAFFKEKSNYTSESDKILIETKKIVRGISKWKLYGIIILLFLLFFRKQILKILLLFFPQAKFVMWLTKIFGSTENQRLTKLEKLVYQNKIDIEDISRNLNETLIYIKNLKPELFIKR